MELIYIIVGLIFLIGVVLAIYEKRKGLRMINDTDPNPRANRMSKAQAQIMGDIQRMTDHARH